MTSNSVVDVLTVTYRVRRDKLGWVNVATKRGWTIKTDVRPQLQLFGIS